MNKGINTTPIAIAILLYCIWNAYNLVIGWLISPFDAGGWIAFIIWISPILYVWGINSKYAFPQPHTASFLFLALLLSTGGMLASLNIIEHIALAFALGAFMPWNWNIFFWLIGAISWMPLLGYVSSDLSISMVVILRICISLISAAWGYFYTFNRFKE